MKTLNKQVFLIRTISDNKRHAVQTETPLRAMLYLHYEKSYHMGDMELDERTRVKWFDIKPRAYKE